MPRAEPWVTPMMALVGFLGLCLLLGIANAALVSHATRAWYLGLTHPAGGLPDWAYRPVWGVTYFCSGCGAWLVWCRGRMSAAPALRLWAWNLAVAAARGAALFGAHSLAATLLLAVVGALLLVAIVLRFRRQSALAAWLMVPPLLWSGYLIYLSAGLLSLNTQ
ncbi:MAG TPA: TspO/MBR family protein [Acetobacteraceae bacterium]|nr:TspO/MBR family protein [Acetobacteraceae bacterium]